MRIVDVNLLLYAVNTTALQHARISAWFEETLNEHVPLGFPWLVLVGFLRISTNPRSYPVPLTIAEASEQMDTWLTRPHSRIVVENDDHWEILKRLVAESGTSGNRTTDAHLAALAMSHNATLVSCDNDFARFRGLRWENPLH